MNFLRSGIIQAFLLAIVLCFCAATNEASAHPGAESGEVVSLQLFYDELAPYGRWVYDRKYEYVWVPDVQNFHPYYTNGYWEITVYGNTWVSLYPWGWAPFHYGRWMFDSFYGWVWVPGYDWAPAWVCWRYGQGAYWWAPLRPGFVITVGFSLYECPYYWWTYTPAHYLYGPRHREHYAVNSRRDNMRNTNIVNHTRVDTRSNAVYSSGPNADEVHRVTGQEVIIRNIEEVQSVADTRVPGEHISIYRPQLSKDDMENMRARPARFENSTKSLKEQEKIWEWNDQDYRQDRSGTRIPEISEPSRQQPAMPARPGTPEKPVRVQQPPAMPKEQPAPRSRPVAQPQPARSKLEQKQVPVERTPQAPVRR